jgi:hypothetical protein
MADFLSHTEKALNWNVPFKDCVDAAGNTNNTASLPKVSAVTGNNDSAPSNSNNKASLPSVSTINPHGDNAAKKGTGKLK